MALIGYSKSELTLRAVASEKYIDIKKVIAEKNPRLSAWMPGLILRYIRRILHENEINDFMARNGQYRGMPFVEKIFEEFGIETEAVGAEHIPREGGVILAANHPLGGPDALALMLVLSRVRTDFKFLVNDVLNNITNLAPLFVPVNKHGGQAREFVEKMEEVYASDGAVLIFPAGLVSRKQRGRIEDLEWKKSFVAKARRYAKPVVPVFISGRNSDFFYNLANLRKSLGVKANIEMFYLADEMYKQRGKKIKVYFGPCVAPEVFDKSKTDAEWAEVIKKRAYALPNEE